MFRKNWPFILASILGLLIIVYFYFLYAISPTLDWKPHYLHNSKSPYGNELLYKVMEDLNPKNNFTVIEEPLINNRNFNNAEGTNNIYFFSGNTFSPNRFTIASLSNFIKKGNQVFIASNQVSRYFLDSILNETLNYELNENGLASVNCINISPEVIHPDLKIKNKPTVRYKVLQATVPMDVGYIPLDFFNTNYYRSDYYNLGCFNSEKKDSYTNYVKIKVGNGWLYLYTSPMVFTNYYLRKPEVFDYAQNVLVNLAPGNVYWHINNYANIAGNSYSFNESTQNPFGVLLSYKSFRYAWYCFLGAIILFCVFGFKRRQRAIPVLEKNMNTSVEYAETIAKFYLADGKHKNIAQQKFRYFFNFVRFKYGINLKNNNAEDKNRLAYLSKIEPDHIDKISFNYSKMESLPSMTEEELKEAVKLINGFYKNSG